MPKGPVLLRPERLGLYERAECPVCGRETSVGARGVLFTHGPITDRCPGSYVEITVRRNRAGQIFETRHRYLDDAEYYQENR